MGFTKSSIQVELIWATTPFVLINHTRLSARQMARILGCCTATVQSIKIKPANVAQRWGKEQDDMLFNLLPTMTIRQIADELGFSYGTVILKMRQLGIKTNDYWDASDDDFLNKNFYTMTSAEMANALGVNVSTVTRAARRLNLRKYPRQHSYLAVERNQRDAGGYLW